MKDNSKKEIFRTVLSLIVQSGKSSSWSVLFFCAIGISFSGAQAVDAGAGTAPAKKVLLLLGNNQEQIGNVLFEKGLRTTMQADSNVSIEYYTEYLNLNRFPEPDYVRQLNEFCRVKYLKIQFDLVVVASVQAFDFVLKYGEGIFPGVPIVAGAILTADFQARRPAGHITGVGGSFDFTGAIETALNLQPDIRNIVVVAGAYVEDQAYLRAARQALQLYSARGLTVTYLTDMTMEELLQRVGQAPPHSMILYIRFSLDSAGKIFKPDEAAGMIAVSANAPVYGVIDTFFGTGIVGGRLLSLEAQGARTGKIALRILQGERSEQIPFSEEGSHTYLFDWRQLKRWGVSEKKLPRDSIVRYEEYTAWEQYRWQIIGAVIAFVLETMLVSILLVIRFQRIKAVRELRNAKEYAENLVQTANALVIGMNAEGNVIRFNQAAERITGYTMDEMKGRNWFESIVPKGRYPNVAAEFGRLFSGEAPRYFENPIVTKSGEERFITWSNNTVREQGQILGTISFGIDITERKQAEEQIKRNLAEKETLLRELYHRTKNNMQVIRSLLLLRASVSPHKEISAFAQEIEQRIQAMALVHQKLYQSKDLSEIKLNEYIAELAALTMQSYKVSTARISLTLDLSSVSVLFDTAIPCGLIVSELMSNALKHAFPEQRSGEIHIGIRRTPSGVIELHFADNGIGVPEDFDFRTQNTLGLQTIVALAEEQLKGKIQFDRHSGVAYTIQFQDTLYSPRV